MHLYSHRQQKPAKTCAVVRYGAIGDAMQMTSILPALKEQGYHITVFTVPSSYEVLKHDPHIDKFVVQHVDIIPNEQLGDLWDAMAKKYDRFINLSESVERTLLPMKWSMTFHWPHEMRHRHLNKNYMEYIHGIAEVPLPSRTKFYPTAEERAWAQQEYSRIGGRVILCVLAGSGVHKVWPHLDTAMDAVLRKYAHARFVLVGDKDCQRLEAGWENTPQVHRRAGIWNLRQTMAFAQVCDLVVGPETGVMNAVSMEPVQKIVTLSHSSVENLTRDWVNTISLTPVNTSCYPCHRLHMVVDGFKHCRKHESGVAACQFDIPPSAMVDAIEGIFKEDRKAA